jgi:hypothetical protein
LPFLFVVVGFLDLGVLTPSWSSAVRTGCTLAVEGEMMILGSRKRGPLGALGAAIGLTAIFACGGGGGPTTPPPTTQPPVPAAAVTATGEGNLVIHPSVDTRFSFALETPLRIVETTGGTADWNFARISVFRKGAEIERNELGSDTIKAAGFGRIAARSNQLVRVAFRQNSDDFDRVDITLGFGDIKDGRQFTALVPPNSFTDVTISLTPLSVTPGGVVRPGP